MTVSIGLSETGIYTDIDFSAGLYLEDDGYYWFLYPYFEEVWKQTGQMIDLYGAATFTSGDFSILRSELQRAVEAANGETEEWEVLIGWKDVQGGEKILRRVSKAQLLTLLSNLMALTAKAEQTRNSLLFLGD